MTLPIPTPAALAQRFAAGLAQIAFTASDGTSVTLDATAPATLENALAILYGLGDYETYLYARDIGIELMVTTATENGLLPQHAQIWGVPRQGATPALGNFLVQAGSGGAVTVPAGALVTVDGTVQWSVTNGATIAAGAVASVAAIATTTGTVGNLAPNSAALFVSPVPGVVSVTSDQNGFAGGAPIQPVESWRADIIAAIRSPDGGGTVADYTRWALAAGAGFVNVARQWGGIGTVGVMILMPGPSVPTPAQVAAVQAYIDARRPVRGNVTVYAGSMVPQDPQILLNPNTVAAQAAVTAALAPLYIAAGLGGTVTVSALQAGIAAVAGTDNDLIAPTADTTLPANQMQIIGTPVYTGAV